MKVSETNSIYSIYSFFITLYIDITIITRYTLIERGAEQYEFNIKGGETMRKVSKARIQSQIRQAQRKAEREVKSEVKKLERSLQRKLK